MRAKTTLQAAAVAAGLILSALGTTLATSTTEALANPVCYKGGYLGHGRVAGSGSGVSQDAARRRARERWRSAAQNAMGSSRATNWDLAQHRSYYCHRSFGWSCTAYGQPCM